MSSCSSSASSSLHSSISVSHKFFHNKRALHVYNLGLYSYMTLLHLHKSFQCSQFIKILRYRHVNFSLNRITLYALSNPHEMALSPKLRALLFFRKNIWLLFTSVQRKLKKEKCFAKHNVLIVTMMHALLVNLAKIMNTPVK